ncbi:hypothetical protein KL919_005274 [Ogataea angusta]|uniref:Uncharacterized protein n=1 Tax=Pichia angusta TaxID=870730 RepID=A0ABQ7RRW9_PICAN|nr:hypothetical protein KL940_004604 [Ogataea angusta]KAG7854480.1 hypothetical protein KL919_005274 [Ogataea angusta]
MYCYARLGEPAVSNHLAIPLDQLPRRCVKRLISVYFALPASVTNAIVPLWQNSRGKTFPYNGICEISVGYPRSARIVPRRSLLLCRRPGKFAAGVFIGGHCPVCRCRGRSRPDAAGLGIAASRTGILDLWTNRRIAPMLVCPPLFNVLTAPSLCKAPHGRHMGLQIG